MIIEVQVKIILNEMSSSSLAPELTPRENHFEH